jgi:hypothetical protein
MTVHRFFFRPVLAKCRLLYRRSDTPATRSFGGPRAVIKKFLRLGSVNK